MSCFRTFLNVCVRQRVGGFLGTGEGERGRGLASVLTRHSPCPPGFPACACLPLTCPPCLPAGDGQGRGRQACGCQLGSWSPGQSASGAVARMRAPAAQGFFKYIAAVAAACSGAASSQPPYLHPEFAFNQCNTTKLHCRKCAGNKMSQCTVDKRTGQYTERGAISML